MKEILSDRVADEAAAIENIVVRKEQIEQLLNTLSALPERDRQILEYKYILDMADGEIAEIFDIKASSVREYLTRARRKALAIIEKGGLTSGT